MSFLGQAGLRLDHHGPGPKFQACAGSDMYVYVFFPSIDGPVSLPNMPNQMMNRVQVSQGNLCMLQYSPW